MADLSVHDAIYSLRAMRRLKPDPVPDAELRYLIDAATQAASGGNEQHWAFVVVTDSGQRRRVGELYGRLGRRLIGAGLESGRLSEPATRVYRNALGLAERMTEVPALIVACLSTAPASSPIEASTRYGSIYPAIQNLMLAARSRGLGTTLTTLHKAAEDELKQILEIPSEVETIALIPVGYPTGAWGRPKRAASREVTHWDRWGGSGPC